MKNHEFTKFCNAVGWDSYLTDKRFSTNSVRRQHESILSKDVQKLFITETTEYWKNLLNKFEVQNEKVQNYKEFVESEQTKALELISWLDQPTTNQVWPVPNLPGMPRLVNGDKLSIAPSLGQHTKEIIKGLGYSEEFITKLLDEEVIFGL